MPTSSQLPHSEHPLLSVALAQGTLYFLKMKGVCDLLNPRSNDKAALFLGNLALHDLANELYHLCTEPAPSWRPRYLTICMSAPGMESSQTEQHLSFMHVGRSLLVLDIAPSPSSNSMERFKLTGFSKVFVGLCPPTHIIELALQF